MVNLFLESNMLKFLMWAFRCASAVLWFFGDCLEDIKPQVHFSDWDGDDGMYAGSSTSIGRTTVGSVEPIITSARGESVGRMSGMRIMS